LVDQHIEHYVTERRVNLLENWEALTNHNIAILQNRKSSTGVFSEKVWIQIFGLQWIDLMEYIIQVFFFQCNPHLLTVQRQRILEELHVAGVLSRHALPRCQKIQQSIL
jgi:hypothetical protein